jgi:hypothetical protein
MPTSAPTTARRAERSQVDPESAFGRGSYSTVRAQLRAVTLRRHIAPSGDGMKSIVLVIAVAAAFLAAGVTQAAVAVPSPHRLLGGVFSGKVCKTSPLGERGCMSGWYRYDTTPPGGKSVATTVQYRYVLEFTRPISVRHRQMYASNVRRSIVAQTGNSGRRVIRPLQMRWTDGWRALIADITYATD